MWIYIKVKEENKIRIIENIKFKTMGCAAAIATSSMVTDLAKGKSIEEALGITKQQVADELGGLPPAKFHCSILATEGIVEAVYDYYSKNKIEISKELEERHQKIINDPHAH